GPVACRPRCWYTGFTSSHATPKLDLFRDDKGGIQRATNRPTDRRLYRGQGRERTRRYTDYRLLCPACRRCSRPQQGYGCAPTCIVRARGDRPYSRNPETWVVLDR